MVNGCIGLTARARYEGLESRLTEVQAGAATRVEAVASVNSGRPSAAKYDFGEPDCHPDESGAQDRGPNRRHGTPRAGNPGFAAAAAQPEFCHHHGLPG